MRDVRVERQVERIEMSVGRATCFYALRDGKFRKRQLAVFERTTAVSVSIKTDKLASCFEVSYTLSEHYDVKLDLKYQQELA